MRARAFREGRGACILAARLWCLATCLMLAGCAFSIPIKPLAGDDLVTGSITPAPAPDRGAPLGHDLTDEDWRRARNALAVALDPLGNGGRTSWDNAESGRSGAFRAAGLPYVRDGEVCRNWEADVRTASHERTAKGSACRAPGEEWRIEAQAIAS